jgi:hypothetical protein
MPVAFRNFGFWGVKRTLIEETERSFLGSVTPARRLP